MLIDSHCHLNYKGLFEQQGEVLERAGSGDRCLPQHLDTAERMGRCDRHGGA
jgi:Tat protein secretion system quality control protein TatD with DNase activity